MFLEFLISIGTSARIFGSKYDSDSIPTEPFSYFLIQTHNYISNHILVSSMKITLRVLFMRLLKVLLCSIQTSGQ